MPYFDHIGQTPGFGNSTAAPPSFVPQIADLGTMIDNFARRRMQLAEEQRRQQEEDRKVASDAEREQYGRRKQDIAEKKINNQAAFERTKATQGVVKEGVSAIARGEHPGAAIVQDPETGAPITANWKFVPGQNQQQPALPPPPVQQAQQPPIQAPPASPPAPQATAQVPPVVGMPMALAQRQLPQAPPPPQEPAPAPAQPAPQPQQELSPQDQQLEQLMQQAAPEQTPPEPSSEKTPDQGVSLEVGMQGGNPRPHQHLWDSGEPVNPEPQEPQGQGPQPISTNTNPGEPVQDAEGHWELQLPGGQVVRISPSEARQAHLEEVRSRVAPAMAMLSDPAIPDQMKIGLYRSVALEMAGLDPKTRSQLLGQMGSTDQQAAREQGMNQRQQNQIASNEKIQAAHDQARMQSSKYAHRGRGGGGIVAQSSGDGSAFSHLDPMKQAKIESAVNAKMNILDREMNWTKLEGVGFDRLDLALNNIRSKGQLAGSQQVEAMMNFFGYIRGGVPAKNETDEFKRVTGNLWTMLDYVGQAVGISNLGQSWTGSEEDKLAFQKGLGRMPSAQRAGLEQAIVESKKVIEKIAVKNISAQANAWSTAGKAFHERAQDMINSKLMFAGMQPRQWYADTPLGKTFEPKTSDQASGGASLDDLVNKLGAAVGGGK